MTVVATSTRQLFWLGTYYWGEARGERLPGGVWKLTPDTVSSSGNMNRSTGLLA